MKHIIKSAVFFGLIVLLAAGCSGSPKPAMSPEEPYAPAIDPGNFVAVIDNPYLPMVPGTTFVYEGKTENGDEYNEVYITSETKEILGVTCIVVKDTVLVDGEMAEQTFDWFAQDKQGNVWYFGEDSKDYENDKVVSTQGSWEAGVDGALPGIVMKANPAIDETYRQEYYKGEAEDYAAVLSLSETVSVMSKDFSNVLMTKEWSALDQPPVYEQKFYVKGIGFIMTKYLDGGFEEKLTEIRRE